MLNLIRWLFFLGVLILWLAWGYRYYKCTILDDCTPPVPIDSAAIKKESHTLFLLLDGHPIGTGYPEFIFNYGSAGPTWRPEHHAFLQFIAANIKEHLQHKLILIGRCTQSEHRSNHRQELYENLGRARALAVFDKLTIEYGLPPGRVEIRGETMPDSIFFSPMQFVMNPLYINPNLEQDISEDDLIKASDTLKLGE